MDAPNSAGDSLRRVTSALSVSPGGKLSNASLDTSAIRATGPGSRRRAAARSRRRCHYPVAFPAGGCQPGRYRGRVAEAVQVSGQVQPDGLADVVGVGVAQLVPAADGPDRRGVPFDECIPCLPVPAAGAYPQVGDRWVITRAPARAAAVLGRVSGWGSVVIMVCSYAGKWPAVAALFSQAPRRA